MDRSEPPGLLEETRHALVQAAFKLIERDGFAATPAAAIADEAGFTERTFFRYFPTKEDVVFSPMESRFDDYLPFIRKHISAHGLTVDSLMGALFEANDRNPSRRAVVLRALALARNNPELHRRLAYHQRWFTDRVTDAVADVLGQDRPDLTAQVIVAVTVTIVTVAIDMWADNDQQTPIRDIAAEARRAVEDGLSGTGMIPESL